MLVNPRARRPIPARQPRQPGEASAVGAFELDPGELRDPSDSVAQRVAVHGEGGGDVSPDAVAGPGASPKRAGAL
jgi:hypothetical protein